MSFVEKYEQEIIRRIYDNDKGVFIEIGPDSDALGLIELRTVDPKSVDYYGKIHVTMQKQQALKIANAILEACREIA